MNKVTDIHGLSISAPVNDATALKLLELVGDEKLSSLFAENLKKMPKSSARYELASKVNAYIIYPEVPSQEWKEHALELVNDTIRIRNAFSF